MEPEPMKSPQSTTPEKQPSHRVNQITIVSKVLALVLFILLPFIGGYIGYMNAPEQVVERVVVQVPEVLEVAQVSENSDIQKNNFQFEKYSAGLAVGYYDLSRPSYTSENVEATCPSFVVTDTEIEELKDKLPATIKLGYNLSEDIDSLLKDSTRDSEILVSLTFSYQEKGPVECESSLLGLEVLAKVD